jgi:hypothetical protein
MAHTPIQGALWISIDIEWIWTEFFRKTFKQGTIGWSNGNNLCPSGSQFLVMLTQLREKISANWSARVPDKYDQAFLSLYDFFKTAVFAERFLKYVRHSFTFFSVDDSIITILRINSILNVSFKCTWKML